MDMSGNVWEWCLNKWDDPQITDADISGGGGVVRGGAWRDFFRALPFFFARQGFHIIVPTIRVFGCVVFVPPLN